jgi:hypothetical protein
LEISFIVNGLEIPRLDPTLLKCVDPSYYKIVYIDLRQERGRSPQRQRIQIDTQDVLQGEHLPKGQVMLEPRLSAKC